MRSEKDVTKFRKTQKGLSLVEMLLAVSLGIFLLGGIYSLQVMTQNAFLIGTSQSELLNCVQRTFESMERDIRVADEIVTQHDFSGDVYQTHANGIVLRVPAVKSDGSMIDGVDDYIAYYIDAGDPTLLYRITDPDLGNGSMRLEETRIIINNLNGLIFQSGGVDLSSVGLATVSDVNISLSVRKAAKGAQNVDLNLSSSVRLRNN